MSFCCEHHYTCQECGRSVNAEERPSPGEPFICDDCWDMSAALTEAIRQQPPGHHTWNGDNAA